MATQALVTATTAAALNAGEQFELGQRQARMFAMSLLVPQHLRTGSPEQAMANCYIAMNLAQAMGEMPLIVMQNIHVINGKAGFASKYMIARANASGKFSDDLDWEITGSGKTLGARCFATLAKSGRVVSMTVDMAMAEAEGWTKNAKYKTMPELMLRYRSASFLVNLYAPEVMLGYRTTEELEDISLSGSFVESEPLTGAALLEQARTDDPAAQPSATGAEVPAGPDAGPAPEEPIAAEAAPKGGSLFQRMSEIARQNGGQAHEPEGRDDDNMGEAPTLDQAKAALNACESEDDLKVTLDSYRGELGEEDYLALSIYEANLVAQRWSE